jgi:hypothetical protein
MADETENQVDRQGEEDLFGSMADETENQGDRQGEEDGSVRTDPQGDRTRGEVAQMRHEAPKSKMREKLELLVTALFWNSASAQGAGGMGPAHGQAPPEAAQGVQRTQNSQVLSFTRTSETAELADLVGIMADEI